MAWLHAANVDSYGIPGFNHEYLTRENKSGGGVSLFINENILYKARPDLSIIKTFIEMIWIEVDKNSINSKTNLLMGVIYRPPGMDPKDFNHTLNDTLNRINIEKKQIIHTGDYNLNLLNAASHLPTNEFSEINFSLSLLPTINRPTRISERTVTLIDNIYTNSKLSDNYKSGIILSDLSDHYPIFLLHLTETNIHQDNYITYRTNTIDNKTTFESKLDNIDWNPILSNKNTQSSYDSFHEIMTKAYCESFPLKTIKSGYSNKLKWLTYGLKKSISQKHKLHTRYLKNPTTDNKSNYKKF